MQIRAGLNSDTQRRFAKAVSEIQRNQLHLSGASPTVDLNSFQFVHDLLGTLCTEDVTSKQMDMFPTVDGEPDQLPIAKSMEARIAALERGWEQAPAADDGAGGKRGRKNKRPDREDHGREDKGKRPQSEPPRLPTHPKSRCPMCDGEHTISRCEKFRHRGLKYNTDKGHHLHGADGNELCAKEPARRFWESEQFKHSPMAKRNVERWNALVAKAPDVAKKILADSAPPALGAINGGWDDDSPDSDDAVERDRAHVADFAAGQWNMLTGTGATAPIEEVPDSVIQERENVAAFAKENVVAFANGAFSAEESIDQSAVGAPIPILNEQTSSVVSDVRGADSQDDDDDLPSQLTAVRADQLTGRPDPVQHEGARLCRHLEGSNVLGAMQRETLESRWEHVDVQESAANRHSRHHSATPAGSERRCDSPVEDLFGNHDSAEGGKDDEVLNDSAEHERRVAAQVAAGGGGCKSNDTGNLADGAEGASACDSDVSDVLSKVQMANRRHLFVRALRVGEGTSRRKSWTHLIQAAIIRSVTTRTDTRIHAYPSKCGRILYFKIYGDGHDCFFAARLLAEHWEVDEEACVLNTGVETDVAGEARFLRESDALHRSLRAINIADGAKYNDSSGDGAENDYDSDSEDGGDVGSNADEGDTERRVPHGEPAIVTTYSIHTDEDDTERAAYCRTIGFTLKAATAEHQRGVQGVVCIARHQRAVVCGLVATVTASGALSPMAGSSTAYLFRGPRSDDDDVMY
jgi:hypothetical protein